MTLTFITCFSHAHSHIVTHSHMMEESWPAAIEMVLKYATGNLSPGVPENDFACTIRACEPTSSLCGL